MTCIAAIVHNGRVFVGADSAGVADSSLVARADDKVFINGPCVIGFTHSFRMGQLLRYAFTPPARNVEVPLERYMVTEFVDAVRDCFKAGGLLRKEHEVETGGSFIVGIEGRIFVIESDFQVAIWHANYAAIGAGRDLALGALSVLSQNKRMEPKAAILAALKAAELYCSDVRGPFVIREQKAASTYPKKKPLR